MLSKNNLVLYEIYPRSYKDSSGNGYGDINGIISKLDYLKDLGVTAVWITPFYPSPMKDGGYDISNYCDVSPEFGTLHDFKNLIKEAHAKKIQIVIDLVVNHTSDQHPWFQESRSCRTNSKRDWYIWKDPVNGGVPNNWMSVFEPTPWQFDIETGQYYFHSFLTSQPDLNWANSEVMEAIKDVMKFWIDLGIDGFRLDAVNYLWKDQRFLDEPVDPSYKRGVVQPFYKLKHIYMRDQSKVFAIVNELGKFMLTHGKGFIITEAYLNKKGMDAIQVYKQYYKSQDSGTVIPFNFELIRIPWNAKSHREFITAYLHALDPNEIPTFVLGNHDKPRIATRIGQERTKLAAVLLLTLPGIPVIYYGEELGMEDVPIPRTMIQDTKEFTSPGFGRDPIRTPMQWDNTVHAGFTTGSPWLPVEKEYKTRNVTSLSQEQQSIGNLYKSLLAMRFKEQVFTKGKYNVCDVQNQYVFAYSRSNTSVTKLILLNYSHKKQMCTLPFRNLLLVLRTEKSHKKTVGNSILLMPNEACILEYA